jgi:HKD family nuclease
MEKLIIGAHLPAGLCSLIEDAKREIVLVCPFIQLHHHFRRSLKKQLQNDKVTIKILYGKYSNGSHFKLHDDDLNFLKTFPNICIKYNSRLHAKFYANESEGIVTSLNLSHTAHDTNLEYGVKLDLHRSSVGKELLGYVNDLFEESDMVFHKEPDKLEVIRSGTPAYILKIKEKFPNAYEKWSDKDDIELERLFCEKVPVENIADIFKRQPGAIYARINKLELFEKYGS